MIKELLVLAAMNMAPPADTAPQQVVCGSRDQALANLEAKFHERVVAGGVIHSGLAVIVTATQDGSTWTILLVDGDDACFLAAGQGWDMLDVASPVSPKAVPNAPNEKR